MNQEYEHFWWIFKSVNNIKNRLKSLFTPYRNFYSVHMVSKSPKILKSILKKINIHSGLNFEWFHETLYIFFFLYGSAPRFYDCHVIKIFWQILKYFLNFKTKKMFSYTWELFRIRNKNVNKFFVKISVGIRS